MPVLKRCCCGCCSLRTGTIILGILGLIGLVVNIGQRCLALANMDYAKSTGFAIATPILDLIFCLAMTIMTVFLLRGVQLRQRQLMDPWIKVTIIFLVLNGIVSGIQGYNELQREYGYSLTAGHIAVYFIVLLAVLAIGFYFWFVVYSYSVELQEEERRNQNPGLLLAPGKNTPNQQVV